jgi:hypothetical protein
MTVLQEKLKKLVSLMVERKILLLKEGKKFQAIRSLTIQAQQAAMKFEDSMVDALELVEPDEMDDDEQRIYSQAMSDMHSKVIEAVVHAANVIKHLKTKPAEQPAVKGKSSGSSSAASGNTVDKPLPTL